MKTLMLPLRYRLPIFGVLILVAASAVYPIAYVGATSLRSNTDYLRHPYALPTAPSFANFRLLIENNGIARSALNSLIVVSVSVVVSVSLAALAAYAIEKLRLPRRGIWLSLFVSVMLVPSQVLILPIYLLISRLGLTNNLLGVILVYTASTIPYGVFLLTTTFRAVPDEVLDAAKVDGAGVLRSLVSVVVPVARTGVITLAILTFFSVWNELILGYILLPDEDKQLLTPKMAYLGGRLVSDQPLLMAGLLITSLPPLILLAVLSRYLVNGLTAGAAK
jgi:ABC-type glycerol-3-phosphate transport system permease component